MDPVAAELWVAAQLTMPAWLSGRMNATVIMVSQGAMAIGGVIWGSTIATFGPSYSLMTAAALLIVSLALASPLSVDFTGNSISIRPRLVPVIYQLLYTPRPTDGPVFVSVEFRVEEARIHQFLRLMREFASSTCAMEFTGGNCPKTSPALGPIGLRLLCRRGMSTCCNSAG